MVLFDCNRFHLMGVFFLNRYTLNIHIDDADNSSYIARGPAICSQPTHHRCECFSWVPCYIVLPQTISSVSLYQSTGIVLYIVNIYKMELFHCNWFYLMEVWF